MLLFKKVKVVDRKSPWHGKRIDIFIKDGHIHSIGKSLQKRKTEIIDGSGLSVSPGFIDLATQVCDPGFEQRDDLSSISEAAVRGGYASIISAPNTLPTVSNKGQVEYIKNRTAHGVVQFFPMGSVSEHCQGKHISEIYDMHHAGAVAFGDGNVPILNAGLMLKALQYVKPFGGVIIDSPLDNSMVPQGKVHEGESNIQLGLRGSPAMAEELMVHRNIQLAEYAESKVHLLNVSVAGSVELIKQAKKKGIRVTASVNPMNLLFDESNILTFDPNYKVQPPLRGKSDRLSLIRGLKSGVIDGINSNHHPIEAELKDREFMQSEDGVSMLEMAFAALVEADLLSVSDLTEKMGNSIRSIFDLHEICIQKGSPANLTFFHPKKPWTVEAHAMASKSKNSPFINQTFKTSVIGVCRGNSYKQNEQQV